MSGPLVSCEAAAPRLDDPRWVFVDCRHEIADPQKGVRAYAEAHIPGAFHAHLDRDLSGPVGDGSRGRHPLPLAGAFVRFCETHGIGPGTYVVAYDDGPGQWASRLWWLLRHYGHADVAVLDGGLTRWKALRLPLRGGHEKPRPATRFAGQPGSMPTVQAADVEAGSILLLDARAPERYRGEVELVDKRAGHIPGAVSAPFALNVGADTRFLPPPELRARYEALLQQGTRQPTGHLHVACYCGSGATGTHDVLAMEVAGLPTPALYPGSWSEWSFPAANRPIRLGAQP